MLTLVMIVTGCSKVKNATSANSNKNTQNIDMPLQLETKHFNYYTKYQDKAYLKDLSSAFGDNYERIITDSPNTIDKKEGIYIYSDLGTYHKEISRSDAPSRQIGNANPYFNINTNGKIHQI